MRPELNSGKLEMKAGHLYYSTEYRKILWLILFVGLHPSLSTIFFYSRRMTLF